jgi:flagellar export protein FliJ
LNGDSARSFETLARLKENDERTAAEKLRAARERLDGERLKLTTVQRYLDEYSVTARGESVQTRLFADRQRFRIELERSVEAQHAAVARAHAQAEAARAHWSGVRAEREAMEKLVEKREAAATRRANHLDQRQSDEQALGQAAKADNSSAA